MKLEDYIDGYDFVNRGKNKTAGLHVIGTCRECKTEPKECEYFRRLFKDENSVTIAGALISFGCIHFEQKEVAE